MAKIVTVYRSEKRRFVLTDMSYIRWLKISEALAKWGHQVDLATNEGGLLGRQSPVSMGKNLKRVPLSKVKWEQYDVVKTLFHRGFETLEKYGGTRHPYIISKLGSVVDKQDRDGIYFYGEVRKWLYAIQEKINKVSRRITVLTRESQKLWESCFGEKGNTLLVPGAADSVTPPLLRDPYPQSFKWKCLFSGNLYTRPSQAEANQVLQEKINRLGQLLWNRKIRLFVMAGGDANRLNSKWVTYLGPVPYEKTWDYFYFAHAGIVLALGEHPNQNESTKIYHYLRAGLPVICESGFPNENVIEEAGLGFVVENGNLDLMAEKIEEAVRSNWDKQHAIQYILSSHTWEKRAEKYHDLFKTDFN